MDIRDLQPSSVWNIFYGITRCPRPSKHEEVIRKHLLDWAAEHSLEAFCDETGNVIVKVPATPRYEKRKTAALKRQTEKLPQKNDEQTQ